MGFLDSLKKKAEARASQVYDQVNMFDNGRTYQQRTPTNNRSVLGQATHNGATNTVGNMLVKPLIINPGQMAVETGRMIAAGQSNNQSAIDASLARQKQNLNASIGGFLYHQGKGAVDAVSALPRAIQGDVTGGSLVHFKNPVMNDVGFAVTNPLGFALDKTGVAKQHAPTQAQNNAYKKGLKGLDSTVVGQMVSPAQSMANSFIPGAKDASAEAGYDVNGSFAKKFIAEPAMGTFGAYGLLKGGESVATKGKGMIAGKPPVMTEPVVAAPKAPTVKPTTMAEDLASIAQKDPASRPNGAINTNIENIMNTPLEQRGHSFAIDAVTQAKSLPKADQASMLSSLNVGDINIGKQFYKTVVDPKTNKISQQLINPKLDPAKMSPDQIVEAAGIKPPAPAEPVPVENAPVNGKQSRFANRTVQKSEEVSPELKQMVAQEKVGYDPHTNEGRLAAASEFLKNKTPDDAYSEVIKSFENEAKVNDQHVVNAIQTAKLLDESAKEGDLMKATEIYDNLSRHLSKKGQEIQAASLLSNRTPQGLYYSALKALRQGKVDPTPEMQTTLKAMTDKIKAAEKGSEARDYAIKEMQQYVARQIPSPLLDKMISGWKAGLLTGVKTITGNAESNLTFRVAHEASKPLAVAIDRGISAFTKKRSQALTYRGSLSGAGEGFQKGWQYFKTGIDERSGVTNKFLEGSSGKELNFKNKYINAYVNGVFRNMGAQDRPFYYSQLRTSLNELATVEGKNMGLKGRELRAHVDKTMADPSMDMMQIAKNEADRAVLAQDTGLSKVAGGLRQSVDRMDPGITKTILKTGIETTMPFTGVPSAFVSRVIDFTPAGPLKLAADRLFFKKEISQRDFSNALAEATTGTGVMWLGSELAKNGQLSGPYPNDPKEQARWKAEGITPNSIKIGGKWVSLNYLGPSGMLLNAGARAHESAANGGNALSNVGAAAGGMPKDLTQQSFLQGVSNAVSAVNDPGRYLNNYLNSQAGSIIPTIINDIGNATDSQQRDRNNPIDAVKSRLPVVRTSLPESIDVFGNKLKATSNPVDRMINPLRPSNERQNDVFSEINRLHGQNVDVMPTNLDKTQSFDGVKVPLTDAQRKQLQTSVGQNTQKLWGEAMKSDEYKALSDDGKKKMLDGIYQTVLEGEKRKFQADNSLGQYNQTFDGKAQKLSKNASSYLDGGMDISKFAKEPGGSGGTQLTINKSLGGNSKTILKGYNNMDTDQRQKWFDSANDNEYKYQQAKYENDKANGTLTKAEDARAKYDLAQAKVGSSYTKEVRDLYSLNKTELYSLLTSDPKGQELANQIVAYGDQLESAGLGNNKWRDSKGNIAFAPKEKGGGSGRKGGKGKTGSALSDSAIISAVGKNSNAAKGAKVSKVAAPRQMSARGIQAYKKTVAGAGPTKVAVVKKQLKLARSTA